MTEQFAEDVAAQTTPWWWQPRRTHNGPDSMSCVLYVPDVRKNGPVTVDDIWREMLVQGLDARTVQVSQISLRWIDPKTPEEQADFEARRERSASLRDRYERETYERLREKFENA
jgi:hypothetical protein